MPEEGEKRGVKLTLRLTQEEATAVDGHAAVVGFSRNDVIRAAIRQVFGLTPLMPQKEEGKTL